MDRYLPMVAPWAVASSEGIALRVQPALAQETVMVSDRPWEDGFITFYTNVIEENGTLRMWYTCRDHDLRGNVAYAQSTDGLNWDKPSLGLAEYGGSRENNLTGLTDVDGSMFYDEAAPRAERYKYVSGSRNGLIVRHSEDGLHHWQGGTVLLPFAFDTQNQMLRDPATGRYVFYLRGWEIHDPYVYRDRRRFVVRYETDDLERPSGILPMTSHPEHKLVHVTGELPKVFGADGEDPEDGDVYTMSATSYAPCPRLQIAFPTMLRQIEAPPASKITYPGRAEVQCIASEDGVSWARFDRRPLLTPSLDTGNASNVVFAGVGLVYRPEEIWQYGTGYRTIHGDSKNRIAWRDGVILRWRHRRDGFVAAEADYHGGWLITAPFVAGDALLLNVDTGAFGSVSVELLDEQGAVLPGYEACACRTIQTNSVRHAVSWVEADIARLAGRRVRARVQGKSFRLYGIGQPEG